jgi:hypothetical protein
MLLAWSGHKSVEIPLVLPVTLRLSLACGIRGIGQHVDISSFLNLKLFLLLRSLTKDFLDCRFSLRNRAVAWRKASTFWIQLIVGLQRSTSPLLYLGSMRRALKGKTIAREPIPFEVLASFSPAGCKVNEYEAPLHGNAVEYCRFF